jgi:RimJ/RimL family protein N-acetyltransferase
MKVIETKRLILRQLTLNDVDNLLLIFEDPIAMRFYPGTKTREEAIQWIEKAQKNFAEKRQGFFACELKETGEFVGICGVLIQPQVDGQDENKVGYLFVRKQWGKGYATEAARACLDYGFHTLGFSRLVSIIDPGNTASIRVAEKNGLKKEKEVTYKGRRADLYVLNKLCL